MAQTVLSEMLKRGFPDAFIAGGVCRDLLLNQEARDIDIFTWHTLKDDQKVTAEDPDYPSDERIEAVSPKFDIPNVGMPCQIIQLKYPVKAPQEIVREFALGIQQAWYNHVRQKIEFSENFWPDVHTKTFNVHRCLSSMEAYHIWRKVGDLRERYPFGIHISADFIEYFIDAQFNL